MTRATPRGRRGSLPTSALGHPRAPMANEDSHGADEGQGDQFHDVFSLRRTERAEKGSRKLLRIDESTASGWLLWIFPRVIPRGWPVCGSGGKRNPSWILMKEESVTVRGRSFWQGPRASLAVSW